MEGRRHVLVCLGPDCLARGAQEVYNALATAVAAGGREDEVVQTVCGCVGPLCGRGPVVCSYPAGVWYEGVRADDVGEIVEEDLGAGRAVDRLVGGRVGQ